MEPVGVSCAASWCALGDHDAAIEQALEAGTSAVHPITSFDASGFAGRAPAAAQIWTAGEAPEDDPQLRILGPHGRILDRVVRSVHDQSALAGIARERIGLYVGLGMVDTAADDLVPAAAAARDSAGALDLRRFFNATYRMIHPLWPLSMLGGVALGQISIDLDIRGDNQVLASDAAGGVRAVLEGARAVRDGIVDVAMAAGISERVCPASLARRQLAGETVPPGEGGAAILLRPAGQGEPARLIAGTTVFGTDLELTAARAIRKVLGQAGSGAIDLVLQHGLAPIADLPAQALDYTPSVGDLGAGHPAFLIARALPLLRAPERRRILVLSGSTGGSIGALILEAA